MIVVLLSKPASVFLLFGLIDLFYFHHIYISCDIKLYTIHMNHMMHDISSLILGVSCFLS